MHNKQVLIYYLTIREVKVIPNIIPTLLWNKTVYTDFTS